jgi:hypothetical protein
MKTLYHYALRLPFLSPVTLKLKNQYHLKDKGISFVATRDSITLK